MLITIRYISGTQDKFEMNKEEFDRFVKWLRDDNSNDIYVYQREYCENSNNIYIYEKKNHTCYILKDKIEYVDCTSV